MPILDELRLRQSTTEWVRTISRSLATTTTDLATRFETMSLSVGADPAIVRSDDTPPLGVHAVGVMSHDGRWQPGILVTKDLAPTATFDSPVRAGELRGLVDLLIEFAGPPPDGVWVVGIQPPDDFAAVVKGDQEGTLGIAVRLPDGSTGALTAGHVAQREGAVVQIGGAGEGVVTYSSHRYLHQSAQIRCADVAVIRFDTAALDFPGIPRVGAVDQMQHVAAFNRSGLGGAGGQPFRFGGEFFPVKESEGSWGDFMMVDGPISRPGDSGSIAVNEQQEVVGHVVGGKTDAYSIIQRITYQLSEAGVTLAAVASV